MIEDGSHIRLKSLRLAYNIPVNNLGLKTFKAIQVYLVGANLFVISDFRLKDPETSQYSGTNDNETNLTTGFSKGQYPTARTI